MGPRSRYVVERAADGTPTRMVGTHEDVTERIEREMLYKRQSRYSKTPLRAFSFLMPMKSLHRSIRHSPLSPVGLAKLLLALRLTTSARTQTTLRSLSHFELSPVVSLGFVSSAISCGPTALTYRC